MSSSFYFLRSLIRLHLTFHTLLYLRKIFIQSTSTIEEFIPRISNIIDVFKNEDTVPRGFFKCAAINDSLSNLPIFLYVIVMCSEFLFLTRIYFLVTTIGRISDMPDDKRWHSSSVQDENIIHDLNKILTKAL